MMVSNIKKQLTGNIDVGYFARFLLLLLILYYGNLFYIAVIDENGRLYSSFLNEHLNYINWLRNSYLYTTVKLSGLIGIHAHITFPYWVTAKSGAFIEMVYECLGLGFFSFWTAFVWANKNTIVTKLTWWIAGVASIWFINCVRVTLLLAALEKHWQYNRFMNHHTLFNYVAYTLIGVFIYYYMRDKKVRRSLAA